MSDNEIPRHELLIKIMGMTTSDNENQALVALRKANTLLREAGWDWDRLLRGKIKVVENPFAGKNPFADQPRRVQEPPRPAPQPMRRTAAMHVQPQYSAGTGRKWEWDNTIQDWTSVHDPAYVAPAPPRRPAQRPQAGPPHIGSTRKNLYAGHCWCCGDYVDNDAGFIFKPKDFNSLAKTSGKSDWAIVCTACNKLPSTGAYIPQRAAPRNTGQTVVDAPLGNL